MRYYDFAKAEQIIAANPDTRRACLGMREDWFWTAQTIFEDGEFNAVFKARGEIGGINASKWATPTLLIEYKDGKERRFDCYSGEPDSDSDTAEMRAFAAATSFGCLSGPAQANFDSIPAGDEE